LYCLGLGIAMWNEMEVINRRVYWNFRSCYCFGEFVWFRYHRFRYIVFVCFTAGDSLDWTSSGTIQVLTPNNQPNTPQFSETLKYDALNNDDVIRPDDAEFEGEADHD
jgi:hypothetical protein